MKEFILPDIGEGIVECELLKWLVAEGEKVVEDQPVAEVMTDKATVEIPAMHSGTVHKLHYAEGDIAKVHAPLFSMEVTGEKHEQQNQPAEETNNKQQPEQGTSADNKQTTGEKIEAFVLPDIGEGIVECEIMQWHIQAGDEVTEDQVVVEVMTDKAVVEIPAKYNGRIVTLHYNKGDIAKVHTPLFDQAIASDGDTQTSSSVVKNSSQTSVNSTTASVSVGSSAPFVAPNDNKQGENFAPPVDVGRAIASPAVRRLAREFGISLSDVSGSGNKGRVLKQDVLSLQNNTNKRNNNTALSTSPSNANHADSANTQQAPNDSLSNIADKEVPVRGIQAAMAKQMVASANSIVHFTVSDELCMDALIELRTALKPEFEKQGLKLSFLPFFIKALSLSLHAFPILNSRLNEDATSLTYLGSHNIGIAVDGKLGLMVPNIKSVQNKSLFDITRELNRLIDAARDGKLSNADLSGGTISISNIGAIGGITATPVINKPDVAIVALGKTQKLPRFDANGEVYASNVMMLNWSGDHRVIDGATMVKFNNMWMDYLTHPTKMLMHLR
ncbi:MAG: dihydrolipoyllysine-residue acetyltransferase [Glaciecola sp.]